jgi:hypothetical protein
MTTINRTIETFVCPNCRVKYLGRREPFAFGRAGRLDCVICNAEIHAWSGNHDYTGWKTESDLLAPRTPDAASGAAPVRTNTSPDVCQDEQNPADVAIALAILIGAFVYAVFMR